MKDLDPKPSSSRPGIASSQAAFSAAHFGNLCSVLSVVIPPGHPFVQHRRDMVPHVAHTSMRPLQPHEVSNNLRSQRIWDRWYFELESTASSACSERRHAQRREKGKCADPWGNDTSRWGGFGGGEKLETQVALIFDVNPFARIARELQIRLLDFVFLLHKY